MPSATRQRLTEAALRRFYRDGFRNVGLDQVLADVGISKTAFYKHFSCKEDLVLAALEFQSRWLETAFPEMVCQRGGETPVGQLRALFDVVDEIIADDEFRGCIFVNVAMEYPLPHDPAHVAAAGDQTSRRKDRLGPGFAGRGGRSAPNGPGTVPDYRRGLRHPPGFRRPAEH